MNARQVTFLLSLACAHTASVVAAQAPGGMPPPPVTVIQTEVRPLTETVVIPARLRATEQVDIRPRVGGLIDRVAFRDGTRVEKGQLLYEIDPRAYAAEVASAEAGVAQAEALLRQASAMQARGSALAPSQALSREAIEEREAARQVAEANLRAARARLESARLNLEYTKVRAPIGGRINRTLVTTGNLVSGPGGNGATLLTTLVPTDTLYAYFDIDERTQLGFAGQPAREDGLPPPVGQRVGLALDGEEGFPRSARIDYLDHSFDAQTGARQARAVLDNSGERLAPGLFARIRLETARRFDAIALPTRAIGSDQNRQFVMVVNAEDVVEPRSVTLGPEIDGMRPVLSGLKPGERVILDGLQRARPGGKVAPKPLEPAALAECKPSVGPKDVATRAMDDCLSSGGAR
ncbi:MAG: efflux RND transporter periplasmic adaptor subunit [Pseudomonadota bacterium]